ncbi:MAG: protein translocase subunit SecF [Patescibacteria group bacterium]
MINIIGKSKIFLLISLILVIVGVVAVVVLGLKPGIDFKGGTLWQVKIITDNRPQVAEQSSLRGTQQTTNDLKKFFISDLGLKDAVVYPSDNQSYLIRIQDISEDVHQKYLGVLKSKFNGVEELKFESIGPAVGGELKKKAFWAIGLVLLGISLFVSYAFKKVSYPVKSWKYGVITLITLFHDVVIPAGLLAILGWKFGVEVDTNSIVALLVIMGFSVHDTIVVFDRIRENLMLSRSGANFSEIVNNSINQTLARSINTTLTVILMLLAMFFFGPATLKYFILTILVGIVAGTYSSIFVASPLLTMWEKSGKVK